METYRCDCCGREEEREKGNIGAACVVCVQGWMTCLKTKTNGGAEVPCSGGLANFSILAYGVKFKYQEHDKVWVKIGPFEIAEWDKTKITDSWIGQLICSVTDSDEQVKDLIVEVVG